MDRDSLLAAMAGLRAGKHFTFQFRVTELEDGDVICTLSRVGADVVVEDYDLDGFGGPIARTGRAAPHR